MICERNLANNALAIARHFASQKMASINTNYAPLSTRQKDSIVTNSPSYSTFALKNETKSFRNLSKRDIIFRVSFVFLLVLFVVVTINELILFAKSSVRLLSTADPTSRLGFFSVDRSKGVLFSSNFGQFLL